MKATYSCETFQFVNEQAICLVCGYSVSKTQGKRQQKHFWKHVEDGSVTKIYPFEIRGA